MVSILVCGAHVRRECEPGGDISSGICPSLPTAVSGRIECTSVGISPHFSGRIECTGYSLPTSLSGRLKCSGGRFSGASESEARAVRVTELCKL